MGFHKPLALQFLSWQMTQLVLFAFLPVFNAHGLQDEADLDEFRDALVNFETALYGQSAVFHFENLTYPERYAEPMLVETSQNGERQRYEGARGSKVFFQGKHNHWHVDEGTYKLGSDIIQTSISTSETGDARFSGFVGLDAMAVDFHIPNIAFGYTDGAGARFSGLLGNAEDVSVSMDGKQSLIEFSHAVGDYSFWFEVGQNGEHRLSKVRLELTPGKEIRGYRKTWLFGKEEQSGQKRQISVYGPIEYDDSDNVGHGPLFTIPFSTTLSTSDGSGDYQDKCRLKLVSRKPLDKPLPDHVEFSKIDLPDKTPFHVINHAGLVFELRDGKVYQLVNGKAMVANGKTRYRPPSNGGRTRWFLISGAVLAAGVFGLLYFRSRR